MKLSSAPSTITRLPMRAATRRASRKELRAKATPSGANASPALSGERPSPSCSSRVRQSMNPAKKAR